MYAILIARKHNTTYLILSLDFLASARFAIWDILDSFGLILRHLHIQICAPIIFEYILIHLFEITGCRE